MSELEIDKVRVIRNTIEGRVSWEDAGKILSLSVRQIGRLCAKIKMEGNRGIIHGLRGRPSNNKLSEHIIGNAVGIVKTHYHDFGPTFACEKLFGIHGIKVSVNTLRKAMIKEGLYRPRKHRPKHRQWRERRECLGMMTQLDGSDHDWFEGRGKRCVLLIFIDDATSRILHGKFISVEDTDNLMLCAKEYLKRYGRPVSFYVDKDSIYKVNRQANIDEELRDEQPLSQFSRAMGELGIEMICANSPQAKGRVERGFKTHQDRLVKELRLAGISDMAQGNGFLKNVYIPGHNSAFAVPAASAFNAHRPLLKEHRLYEILCKKTIRTLANDYTLRYKKRFLQITAEQQTAVRPGAEVLIEERLDGSLRLKYRGIILRFRHISKRPAAKRELKQYTGISVPAANHPWRRYGQRLSTISTE